MALIKMVRSEPRVAGGSKEGMFDEALVADLKKLGWKPADKANDKDDSKKDDSKKDDSKKDESKSVPVKDESKVDAAKTESKVDEKKEDKDDKGDKPLKK